MYLNELSSLCNKDEVRFQLTQTRRCGARTKIRVYDGHGLVEVWKVASLMSVYNVIELVHNTITRYHSLVPHTRQDASDSIIISRSTGVCDEFVHVN